MRKMNESRAAITKKANRIPPLSALFSYRFSFGQGYKRSKEEKALSFFLDRE